ncbi:hypothetical protein HHL26_06755 [Sphingobium sp. TB-6]|uniref:hypothetical protein n=1 Tax=Sphingobium sp. TB-6 TaxID=2728850 RepID=UPI00146E116C|nr:hypothetical protein [Sphingobium sp. TB-6]NML88766.1 hypothetical protein [Sphingobium sp. TB-6]
MPTAFDTLNKSATMALSGGNLVATSSGVGTAAAARRISGLTYCEFTITTLTGTSGVGFVNVYYNMAGGVVMGTSNEGLSYRSSGVVARNNATITTLATYAQGDRVDMAIDVINRRVWFRVNGGNWNNSPTADPVTNAEGIDYTALSAMNVAPAVTASATGTVITAAFDSFAGTPPTGFQSITAQQGGAINGTQEKQQSYATPTPSFLSAWLNDDGGWYGGNRVWAPASPATSVSGQVQEYGTPVPGKAVYLYDVHTGEKIGEDVSDGSGNFSIPALGRTSVFAVAIDPPFNAIIYDQVVPV